MTTIKRTPQLVTLDELCAEPEKDEDEWVTVPVRYFTTGRPIFFKSGEMIPEVWGHPQTLTFNGKPLVWDEFNDAVYDFDPPPARKRPRARARRRAMRKRIITP